MKTSAIFATAFFLTACGVARPVLDRDNTKVEVRTVIDRVVDTSYVQLPKLVEKVATHDTVSVLENKYARSAALVSGGLLYHSMETKAVPVPVQVQSKIVYKDSIVFRDRVQTVTVEVEKPLTRWQRTKQKVGGICFLLILIYIIYFVVHYIFNLNPSKL
ncbi:MAG: hypothetical protein K6F47_11500 [Bacteroidaceae bacterium]|nr:hypothetical protein [Bacteroidaceae bacterium]